MKLTPQQRLFAHEYVRHQGNATEAAKAAGYSERTAYAQGSRLLKHAEVAKLVVQLQERQLAKVDAGAERVKAELARLAFVDLGAAYDDQGRLLGVKDIPEDTRRAISGIKVFEEFDGHGKDRVQVGEVREVKLSDKVRALELLAKHHGMLKDVVQNLPPPGDGEITDEEWTKLSQLEHEVRGG